MGWLAVSLIPVENQKGPFCENLKVGKGKAASFLDFEQN